jgi:pimeloyl-ACP methyl ester carboxylesterase
MEFALIHGGYHGGWVWEPVLSLLDGHALAVDLPGRGDHPAPLDEVTVERCADSVAADVTAAGLGPLAIVGHSLGGVVVPAAADRLAGRVEQLVFVASLIAPDGKCAFDAFPPELRSRADERLRDTGGAGTTIDIDHHRDMLCNDLTDEQAAWVLERLVPDSLNLFTDRVDWGRAGRVHCHYVKLLQDRSLPPPMQDVMIGLLPDGTTLHEIDAGHEVMISQPEALAEILRDL